MQQLTVHIPDNKVAFFLDLAGQLGIKVDSDLEVPLLSARKIELLDEARNNITLHPEKFLDWNVVHAGLLEE